MYNIGSNVDASVIDEVRQRPVCTDLDCAPSDKEISKALQQAKKNKAVGGTQEFLSSFGKLSRETMRRKHFSRTIFAPFGKMKARPRIGSLTDLK